jgi:O-antigen/teichoic acid export membrane protein
MDVMTVKTEKAAVRAKPEKKDHKEDATRKQIRGSSLLLSGKVISVGINFVAQVLVVRYLSKTDYGAWAYALAIVAFFHGFSSLGLRRGITRFIPIYHEKEQFEKLFGTIFMTLGTIFLTGLIIIGSIYAAPGVISHLISGEDQPVTLILILIFMVPVQALDETVIGLFASFSNPRAIFFRKFVIGPGIKLIAILLVILFKSRVFLLAYAYLAGNVLAILLYAWMFMRLLQRYGLMKKFSLRKMNYPIVEVFSFTIPLLTSDLVTVLMHSSNTLMLGYFHNTAEVALYQVILPAAHFNKLVMMSFSLLYTPVAARLFAKENYKGINELYWQTAIWMGVLSFPLFALTFSMAESLVMNLYGARYEASWVFLQLLSIGYYFNVVMGFNGLTLKVLGKVRYVVIINIVAVILNLILNLIFIPHYGALGASIATCISMIIHNTLKQAGLKLASGIKIFDWHYFSYYLVITFAALGLFFCQRYLTDNIFILVGLVGMVSLAVLKLTQSKLNVNETFPEIMKLPLMKYIFSTKKR